MSYAEYNPLGIFRPYSDPHYEFYEFNTKRERDEWLRVHQWSGDGRLIAAKTKKKTIKDYLGNDFVVDIYTGKCVKKSDTITWGAK